MPMAVFVQLTLEFFFFFAAPVVRSDIAGIFMAVSRV